LHYLATTVAHNRDSLLTESIVSKGPQVQIGGGILLLDKPKVEELGLFDEKYLMGWGDDGHLYQ